MMFLRVAALLFPIFSLALVVEQPAFAQLDELQAVQAEQGAEVVRRIAVQFQNPNAVVLQEGNPDDVASAEETHADDEPTEVVDTAEVDDSTPAPNDQFIRLHMWDGSIVGGDLAIENLSVTTEFGRLEIPVSRIVSFHPGLDSYPQLSQRLSDLVEGLGDRNYDVREKSHRELLKLGTMLREEIVRYDDGGSAERKKHLAEIKKEIEEQLDEIDDEEIVPERPLIRGDTVKTADFSIVGKIEQSAFEVKSRFGMLTVPLADIKFADRAIASEKSDIRKVVKVPGATFFQRKPKSSGIRVNKGDRISVRASGTVDWTNWSQTSSPEGMNNQGQWHGINCGTLVGMIGKNSDPIKLGSSANFVAERSGIFYLGIAVRDNHAQNDSYRWEGEFKAKITVRPKSTN